jgi:hypothetical protein
MTSSIHSNEQAYNYPQKQIFACMIAVTYVQKGPSVHEYEKIYPQRTTRNYFMSKS